MTVLLPEPIQPANRLSLPLPVLRETEPLPPLIQLALT